MPIDIKTKGEFMKKILIISLSLIVAAGTAWAVTMKKHVDKPGNFTIEYPSNWKKQKKKNGINVGFEAKKGVAQVQVIHSHENDGKSADAVLAEIESHMGGTHVNQLPEGERHHKNEGELTARGADEEAKGYYDLDYNGVKVHQFIEVLHKGQEAYVVIVTYADQVAAEYGEVAKQIGDSLVINH